MLEDLCLKLESGLRQPMIDGLAVRPFCSQSKRVLDEDGNGGAMMCVCPRYWNKVTQGVREFQIWRPRSASD